jgi:hypothetical protein
MMKRVLFTACMLAWVGGVSCTQKGGPLRVDTVEPVQGTVAGGEEITILGSGFQPGKTQAEVRFGRKKSESVIIASDSKIKVVSPPGDKGPIDVSVAFDDGSMFKIANAFRYVEPGDNDSVRRAFLSSGAKAGGTAKIELEKK